MAKSKANKADKDQDPLLQDEREFVINFLDLKDKYPTYKYVALKAVPEKLWLEGSLHTDVGPDVVHDDFVEALETLIVHLAYIDGAFGLDESDKVNIEKLGRSPILRDYDVSGFKVKGSISEEKIVIVGSKHSGIGGGRIRLETPPVLIEDYSPYKPAWDLKQAIDNIRREIELYMGGKCAPKKEETDHPDQTKMVFEQPVETEAANDKDFPF